MRYTIIALCIIALLGASCGTVNPPVEPPVTTPDTGALSLQWEVPQPGSHIGVPVFTEDVVVFPNVFGPIDKLLTCLDKQTGNLIWNYGSSILDEDDFASDETVSIFNDVIVGCGEDQMVSVDVAQGQTIWESNLGNTGAGGTTMALLGDHVYHMHHHNYPHTEAHLVRSHYLQGGGWDTLCSFYMIDNYELFMAPPSLYVKPNGDSLVIIHLDQLNFGTNDSRSDLIAFSLQSQSIEWRMDDFEPDGQCNVRPVTIHDDKVYVMGKLTVHCFDANTGEKLWDVAEPEGLLGSVNLVIAEGKVIVKPTTGTKLNAYDVVTGQLKWSVTADVQNPNGGVYYNGHLFITGVTNNIYVYRVSDGKLVYLKSMPNRDFRHPLSIDPASGLLFTSDGKNALCFKISL